MRKCTDAVVDWMIQNNTIDEAERDLYKYAICSLFFEFSPLLLAVVIGVGIGCVDRAIVLVVPFMVLRKFSGGYHSQHLWSCMIESSLLLLLCIALTKHVKVDWVLIGTTIIASVNLMIFSPIDNENRQLAYNEKATYKKMTIILIIIFVVFGISLYFFKRYTYMICIFIGIQLAAGLQIPCIIKCIYE